MQCLRDGAQVIPAFDPKQPELLYRCPRCGTRYGATMDMLPEPRSRPLGQPPPGARLPGGLGQQGGLPAPTGRIEQIGRLAGLVAVILFCLALLVFAGERG